MAGISLNAVFLVAAGGALGAVSRMFVNAASSRVTTEFPLGTLLVNIAGCTLAGMLLAGDETAKPLAETPRAFFVVGFLGALTTFSTFSAETLALYRKGEFLSAGLNVLLNVGLALACVSLGWVIGRWWRA